MRGFARASFFDSVDSRGDLRAHDEPEAPAHRARVPDLQHAPGGPGRRAGRSGGGQRPLAGSRSEVVTPGLVLGPCRLLGSVVGVTRVIA